MEVAPLLRRRPLALSRGRGGAFGVDQLECVSASGRRLGKFPALAFSLAYTLFVITGVTLALLPPSLRTEVAGQSIPADSKCYRVIRKANYVTVEYAIGAPTRRVQVLLRLDKVVKDSEHSVHLFGERVIESKSMQCDEGGFCRDAILLTNGPPNRPLQMYDIAFAYKNPFSGDVLRRVARSRLGLAGEMYASFGYRYYLSSTHLCVSQDGDAAIGDTGGALRAHVDDGDDGRDNLVVANVTDIGMLPRALLGNSAVFKAHHLGECEGDTGKVFLWPGEAASDSSYLAITDLTIYESEPDAVAARREVAELGSCARELPRYQHTINLYLLDCSPSQEQDNCNEEPTLPFRRIATYGVRAHYTAGGEVYYWFKEDPSLATLPGMANSNDSVLFAIIKLGVLVLAAAVMWVRSDRATSCSHWLYRHCIRVASCLPVLDRGCPKSSVLEDALLGLTACAARVAVVVWRLEALVAEDQVRVCITELTAAAFSLTSWVLRFWIIAPNMYHMLVDVAADGVRGHSGPLMRLGGSMAIVDASCAVLLAFSEPPLYLSNVSRFDDTARLLVGLVVALVTLNRCLFAVACNAIMFESHHVGRMAPNRPYKFLVLLGMVMWLGQTVAVAVVLSDLVASPMAFQMTRGVVGEDSAVGVALFLALICVSLPRLMHTSVELVASGRGD